MKENVLPSATPTHSPVKSTVKNHEQPGTVAPPIPPALVSDAQISSSNVTENGNNQDAEGKNLFVIHV